MEEDFIVEEILIEKKKRRKGINSGSKGKTSEREVCKILNDRFKGLYEKYPQNGQFSRSIGSGNRFGQKVVLSQAAKDTFLGDLTCPTNFKFVIECKCGYNHVDLSASFNGHKQLDDFISQSVLESNRTGRIPLLLWKKDYRPWLAFIQNPPITAEYQMKYREWMVIPLEVLLSLPDEFFFTEI